MRSVRARLDWLSRDAAIIIVARGFRAAGMGILVVLIAPYLDRLGHSALAIGAIFTLSLVGGMAMSIPATVVGDLIGRRRLFAILSLITAVAGLGLALTDNLVLLGIGSFFGAYAATGMNVGPLLQLEQTGLTEAVPGTKRTTAFAYLGMVSSTSLGIGHLAGGLPVALAAIPGVGEITAFRAVFFLYAGLNFAAMALYLFLTPAVEARWKGARRAVNPLTTRHRGRIIGLSALFGMDSLGGGMVTETFVSLWFVKRLGVGVEIVGPVFVAAQIVNTASLWAAARLADRIGLLNTMVWTHVMANSLLLGFAFVPWGWLAITLWLLRAFWKEMDVPTRQSYSMGVVDSEERMTMAGTANIGRATFRVPGPYITGWLWAASVNPSALVVGGAIKLGYDALLLLGFRGVKPAGETPAAVPGGRTRGAGEEQPSEVA